MLIGKPCLDPFFYILQFSFDKSDTVCRCVDIYICICLSRCISRFYDFTQATLYRKSLISRCLEHAHITAGRLAGLRVYIGLRLGTAVLYCYSWQLSAALFATAKPISHEIYSNTTSFRHNFIIFLLYISWIAPTRQQCSTFC